ncbi:MAG: hypothetical protein PUF50_03360 [Erysipelotrichaceae bacterium]|nr:hypothetical protein [Erysipelotrichaceae bacterium]
MNPTILIILLLIFAVLLFVGILYLQVRLCHLEKHWYGLILPAMSSIFALNGCMTMVSQGGLLNPYIALLVWNIPGLAMIFIYFKVRYTMAKNQQYPN